MIVAITGANGFIGTHLVRRFREAGWDVRELVRRDIELDGLRSRLQGADVVVHAAGATRAPSSQQLHESNVTLTARVLDDARTAAVGRFVFVSSLAAAGPAQSLDRPVDETTTPAPIDPYGRSKLDAEHAVQSSGVPFVIVRPAAVYGPRDRDFLALFRLARLGVALHAANRDHWLSIIHADDLAQAIVRIASAPDDARGRIYCLGNDEPVQWAELFRLAARCANRVLRVDLEIPWFLIDAGAAIGDVVAGMTGRAGLLTTPKVMLSKARFWTCSSKLVAGELGFVASTPLELGLCDTYKWYRENGWL